MAKSTTKTDTPDTGKTREELIAEANATSNKDASDDNEPDAPLSPEAQKAADAIINQTEEQVAAENLGPSETDPPERSDREAAAESAIKTLRRIFAAYPPTTPNEHICFGNGGGKFTLGDFRALMAVVPPE